MEESVKVNPLATEKVERLILKFSIPAIISMLVSSLYNIVDQIFIGQGVGLLGNAATNIAFPITIICTATALLLGIGSASNFNLSSGAGEQECACRYAGTGLAMLMLCGVTIAVIVLLFLDPLLHVFGVTKDVLPYAQDYTGITAFGIPFLILTTGGNHLIRADRSPTYSMTCMLTGAIINTILDPTLIFGFHMMLKPRGMYIKGILTLGMASCINQIAMAIVQIVLNNTLRYYGSLSVYGSDIPLACVGVIAKVNMVFMAICIGLAQGCQPIWGFNYGAGNYGRVRHTYKQSMQIALAVGGICFVCFQVFPRQIVSIFGNGSEEYFRFAERYFRIYMFMTFVNGIHPVCSQFFTAIGKAAKGAVVSLTRQILFLLPLIIIFPIFIGIDGVMYAGPIADGTAAVVAIVLARSEIKKMS